MAETRPDELTREIVMDPIDNLRPRADRRDAASRDQLLRRVRAEFAEMPCLRLTGAQAQRLFGLRPDICDRVLAALVTDQIIYRDSDDQYRAHDDLPALGPKARVPD